MLEGPYGAVEASARHFKELTYKMMDEFAEVGIGSPLLEHGRAEDEPRLRETPLQAAEIIPGRYYVVAVKSSESVSRSAIAASNMAYCIDGSLVRAAGAADVRVRPERGTAATHPPLCWTSPRPTPLSCNAAV